MVKNWKSYNQLCFSLHPGCEALIFVASLIACRYRARRLTPGGKLWTCKCRNIIARAKQDTKRKRKRSRCHLPTFHHIHYTLGLAPSRKTQETTPILSIKRKKESRNKDPSGPGNVSINPNIKALSDNWRVCAYRFRWYSPSSLFN